jgi:5-methylcytosine-specific restriction endonuclease McrA
MISEVIRLWHVLSRSNCRSGRMRSAIRRRKMRCRLLKLDPHCSYCGRLLSNSEWWIPTLDHFWPKSKGGSDAAANLYLACWRCNQRKGSSVRSQQPTMPAA